MCFLCALQRILKKKLSVALAVKVLVQSSSRIAFHSSQFSKRITAFSFYPTEQGEGVCVVFKLLILVSVTKVVEKIVVKLQHSLFSISLNKKLNNYCFSEPNFRIYQFNFVQLINSFFLLFGQVVYIFEERPKLIQDVIEDVYFPGKYCFSRDNCESLDGYVTTPRSI